MANKNKKKYVILEKEKCDAQHIYAAINIKAMENAMANLTGDTFKVWCYFAKNQPTYSFELSSKHCMEITGVSRRHYDAAIAEMIEKGFLNDTGTVNSKKQVVYRFLELP